MSQVRFNARFVSAVTFAAVVVVFAGAAQIFSSGAAPRRRGERLVILSPHWEGIIKEFSRGFSEWMRTVHNTDAYVEHLDVGGGTGTILRYIESEFKANPHSIGVDVLFGGGDAVFRYLADKGLLQQVKLPRHIRAGLAFDIAGQEIHDPAGFWYGAALSGFGIVWNKRIAARMGLPEVSEWRDLTNPRLYGWVACGDPSSSGSVRMVFEVILQAYGFDAGYATICQIAGNVAAFDEGGNSAARNVAIGQSAFGLTIDFYGREQVAACGEENVSFILPKQLTAITPDPIAVIKGAPNRTLAERFIEYVLCPDGQKLWYLKTGSKGGPVRYGLHRLPVLRELYGSGLPTAVEGNPFEWGGGLAFDAALARKRSRILEDLARATLLDVHRELRDAWRAVIDAGEPPELVREFSRPPCSHQELIRIASEEWADPTLRAQRMAEWTAFAREKFAQVKARSRSFIERNGL